MRDFYIQELNDLVESQKFVFKKILKNNVSILDISYGVLLHDEIIKHYGENIDYDFKILDIFNSDSLPIKKKYDITYCFEFCHYKNWKKLLIDMTKIAKKYVYVEIAVTKNHKTIDNFDKCYYYNPYKLTDKDPEKLPFIIQNINELSNFCEKELPIKSIIIYVYHLPKKSTAIYPILDNDLLKGGLLLTIGKSKDMEKKVIIDNNK